jgi:hypothetical protein
MKGRRLLVRIAGLLVVLGMTSALAGCENLCLEQGLQTIPRQPQAVCVTNPELKREYEILQASGIYEIVDQTNGVSRLTLKPVTPGGGCGMGAVVPMFTLGIIPGIIPTHYGFQYDLETDGVVEHRLHLLPVYTRISIWEGLLKPFHKEEKILAKALARSPAMREKGNSYESIDRPVQIAPVQSPKARTETP